MRRWEGRLTIIKKYVVYIENKNVIMENIIRAIEICGTELDSEVLKTVIDAWSLLHQAVMLALVGAIADLLRLKAR